MSEQHPPSRRVVVGVDGSASATAALRWAVAEARLRGAPLSVVHVAADIDDGYANACPDDVLDEALSVASVDADVGTPAVAGLRLTGQPVSELVEQSLDAGLMVVGRHGNPDRLHRR
ncbi:MAG: universal stress protein [Actinomycetota bacterium]